MLTSDVLEFRLPIDLNILSEHAYVHRLKSQFIDFATPATVRIKCDGTEIAFETFREHLDLPLNISTPEVWSFENIG